MGLTVVSDLVVLRESVARCVRPRLRRRPEDRANADVDVPRSSTLLAIAFADFMNGDTTYTGCALERLLHPLRTPWQTTTQPHRRIRQYEGVASVAFESSGACCVWSRS